MSGLPDDTRAVTVLAVDKLLPDTAVPIAVGLWQILLIRTSTGIYALNDRCSHAAARLSPGRVRAGTIMCPRHGARFNVSDGRCVTTNYPAVRSFPVSIVDDRIVIQIPNTGPAMNEMPLA